MHDTIEKLRQLFKTLEETETQIAAILQGKQSSITSKTEAIPVKETIAGVGEGMACCGSKGRRHKKGCTNGKTAIEVEGKRYKCTECGHEFEDERGYLDVTCPSCDTSRVIQLPK